MGSDIQTPFLLDTGATFTSIGKEGSKLRLTRKTIKTMGFSGKIQTLRFTEPQRITVEGITVQAPLLYSPDTPANLLGRDVLCKLGEKIHCGPTGIWVTLPDIIGHQCVAIERDDEQDALDKVYWLEVKDKDTSDLWKEYEKWKPWLMYIRSDCIETRDPWHCTIKYDINGLEEE